MWFVNGPIKGAIAAKSARIVGTRLTGWVFAKRGGASGLMFQSLLGQDLVYGTFGGELRGVRLLPSGQLGEVAEPAGAAPPSSSTGSPAIRLHERAVRIVIAKQNGGYHLGTCCDAGGNIVHYAQMTFTGPSSKLLGSLGLDRHGRLWLVWWTSESFAVTTRSRRCSSTPRRSSRAATRPSCRG